MWRRIRSFLLSREQCQELLAILWLEIGSVNQGHEALARGDIPVAEEIQPFVLLHLTRHMMRADQGSSRFLHLASARNVNWLRSSAVKTPPLLVVECERDFVASELPRELASRLQQRKAVTGQNPEPLLAFPQGQHGLEGSRGAQSQSPGELGKRQTAGLHPHSFRFRKSGVRPENLHFS